LLLVYLYNCLHLGVDELKRFNLIESNGFPFARSRAGLYLNNDDSKTQTECLATTGLGETSFSEYALDNNQCLVELYVTPRQQLYINSLGRKHCIRLKNKHERNKEVRKFYFNKLIEYGCINHEDVLRNYTTVGITKDKALNLAVMNISFKFDNKIKTYKNLSRSHFFYHKQLDIIIECYMIELFVYNARMTFLISDFKGLEFCRYVKNIEVASTKSEQEALINECIVERLYKRMIKKLHHAIDLQEFKNNIESYNTIYEMWRI
jgi:hypothetical protein